MTFLSIFFTSKLDIASIATYQRQQPCSTYNPQIENSSANDCSNLNECLPYIGTTCYHSVPTNLHLKYCSG